MAAYVNHRRFHQEALQKWSGIWTIVVSLVQARLSASRVRQKPNDVCRHGGATAVPRSVVLLGLSALAERACFVPSTVHSTVGIEAHLDH
jgi:hypothetical protein